MHKDFSVVEDWLKREGVRVLVDGQYGSTGKGLLASKLASLSSPLSRQVSFTNAGPNSGHTFYHRGAKHVLMQLPTFAVKRHLMGLPAVVRLTHGAVIDVERLRAEAMRYPGLTITVSKWAAVADKHGEADLKDRIGSTGKGTGAGIANKALRQAESIYADAYSSIDAELKITMYEEADSTLSPEEDAVLEVSQGYSLGINAGFYPFCTSRDCTVAQAMSDAGFHPSQYGGSVMTVRTYPIRVGGNSGPCYPDQRELTWEQLGVEPETTTVTGKVRRVFTWSAEQYKRALLANRPDIVFLNFANYLESEGAIRQFVYEKVDRPYYHLFGHSPLAILVGTGPTDDDVYVWDGAPF